MKAQKLGLVLGMNMAVACLMMQGCKVVKPDVDGTLPPPVVDPTVTATVDPAPAEVEPQAPTTTVTTVPTPPEVKPAPVVESQPTKVATVKPLPPAAQKAPAKATPAASGFVYTVKPGDQLFAVSRRYNVKLSAIEKANPGLNPNRIRVGQKITIPGVAASAVAAAPAKDAKVVQASAPVAASTVAPVKTKSSFKPYTGPTKEYKVRSGDSLGKIAYENGITIRALKEMNKLTKDSLRVGQVILIPAAKVVAASANKAETVKAGPAKVEPAKDKDAKPVAVKDAPAAEAAKPAPAPAAETKKEAAAPALVAPAVQPAAAAEVPAAEPAVADEQNKTVAEPVPAAAVAQPGVTYTVKENDDIISVAIAWGISPSQLMDLNGLKLGDAIKPGQVLKLPANAKQSAQ